jgi:hypothetical protein
MEIRIATDQDEQKWDEIVARSPNGELFHTWKWLKIMERFSVQKKAGLTVAGTLYPVFLMEKEKIVGICPLFLFKAPLVTSCYSPPLNVDTLYLGPLFPDLEALLPAKQQIFLHDVQIAVDRFIRNDLKANYVQINTPPSFGDCRFFKWGGYEAEARYTSHLDISQGTELIWKSLNRGTRRFIDKAKKEEITVSAGDKEDLFFIYDLLKERGRIQCPREFIGAVFDTFSPANLTVFIAKVGTERLSGIVTLLYRDKVAFWIGAPKCSYKGTYPNELLVWEAIRWAEEHHYKTFEIIGADDYSLFPFKRKFNAQTVMYFQMKWFSPKLHMVASVYKGLFKRDENLLEPAESSE